MRREKIEAVRAIMKIKIEGKRCRGKLEKIQMETIENDMRSAGV